MLENQLQALIEGCPPVSALANTAALLWDALDRINWVGFYLIKDSTLHLGPFQGKTACTSIALGRGVCGTAAAQNNMLIVPDVHAFPGHIACDSASNSEIVIPLVCGGRLLGVMDIDSPCFSRFDKEDGAGLAALCRIISNAIDWSNGLL